ncbi:MAG: hypothetical protein ABSE69_20245 [Roseiarcus sp.]|jgi:hypothetical protein
MANSIFGRRAALGLLAGAPALAILPASASPSTAPAALARPNAAALAVAAHKAAQATVEAMEGGADEDAFAAACDDASEALRAVAETPCATDADFLAKAAYLVECERQAWGSVLSDEAPFGLLALATELHVKGRATLELER